MIDAVVPLSDLPEEIERVAPEGVEELSVGTGKHAVGVDSQAL